MRAGNTLIPKAVGLSVVLSFLMFTPAAQAETIQIDFTGLDFLLDSSGQDVFDAEVSNTARASLDKDKSDELSTVEFRTDSSFERDTSNVFGDLYIQDADKIPKDGGIAATGGNGNTFGFDLFGTSDVEGPWSLELNLDKLDVLYVKNPITGKAWAMLIGGEVSSVVSQNLPFGLADIDTTKPVTIAISSSNVWDVSDDGAYLTEFNASGTGTITATLIPEPSTLAGLLMGVITLVAFAWIRRKR